jgi:hypothetical protein
MPRPDASIKRRDWLARAGALAVGPALAACGSGGSPGPAPRSWRMGFSGLPPRLTVNDVIQTIDTWSPRGEIAAIHEELPWTDLLGGVAPEAILTRDKVGLVDYFRGKGHQLMFMADLTDGLSRADEAPQLRALGRSLAEPAVQLAARSYIVAVAQRLQPEYLGLAAETNLIRAAAPPALYHALRQTANAASADLNAAGFTGTRFISVQVETAWGVLGGNGPFVGIAQDRVDFPFSEMLGLSSYPYFSWPTPEDIPADYYTRLQQGHGNPLPVMVVEGGWASQGASANGVTVDSNPALQARYIARHPALLDSAAARGWIQLVFADLDIATLPPPLPANLPLFISLGLVDSQYQPKPALTNWDAAFARPRG